MEGKRRFSDAQKREFLDQADKLRRDEHLPINEITDRLGLTRGSYHRWRKQLQAAASVKGEGKSRRRKAIGNNAPAADDPEALKLRAAGLEIQLADAKEENRRLRDLSVDLMLEYRKAIGKRSAA